MLLTPMDCDLNDNANINGYQFRRRTRRPLVPRQGIPSLFESRVWKSVVNSSNGVRREAEPRPESVLL